MPISLDDKVKKAEILLALKLVSSNYSFNSYSGIGDVSKIAFLDSDIAQHMQISSTKVSYLIVHGLAPYFRTHFMNELKDGIGYLTIYFDETTTRQVKKQMDLHVDYWSPTFKKVVSLYVDSTFLGHAAAETIMKEILAFLQKHNLDAHMLLQCSMDGPAVNPSFVKKFSASLHANETLPLIDVGTCTLHPVHTAFTKGLSKLNFDIEQFSNDIFFWFKLSAGLPRWLSGLSHSAHRPEQSAGGAGVQSPVGR